METNENLELQENMVADSSGEIEIETAAQAEEKYVFSLSESIYAWFCIVAGFFFCKVGTAVSHPLGALAFIVALFSGTTAWLWHKGVRPNKPAVAIAASAVVAAVSVIITSNGFVQFIAWAYCLAAYCLYVYTSTGNSLAGGLSNYIGADFIRAIFVLPVSCLTYIFEAAFAGKKGKGTNTAGKVIAGLLIAVIPTAVVLVLLSYDDGFMDIIGHIFDFSFENIISDFFCLIFAVPVAMYLFGAFMAGRQQVCSDVLTAEKWDETAQKFKLLPVATALAAVLPVLSLYVIFFISQWKYYVSGFVGVLPDEYSYTNYAREGFFQLCAVAFINFVIIALIALFIRSGAKAGKTALKILSIVFAVFTIVLISTALAKMVMYINCYGLTHKRVYASWFMLLLALLCLIIIAKQFAKQLKLILISVVVCVVMFLGLAVSNVDSFIAAYNVDRYLDGSLDTVDVEAMLDLGDSAVPHMVRLANELSDGSPHSSLEFTNEEALTPSLYTKCCAYLYYMESEIQEGVFNATIPRIRAEKALSDADIEWDDLASGQQDKVYIILGQSYSYIEY